MTSCIKKTKSALCKCNCINVVNVGQVNKTNDNFVPHVSPPKVALVVLQFIHDPNTTGRPRGVENVHNSQCLGPVLMHLNIAVIHLIVFTVGTGIHTMCVRRGESNPLLPPKLLLALSWDISRSSAVLAMTKEDSNGNG